MKNDHPEISWFKKHLHLTVDYVKTLILVCNQAEVLDTMFEKLKSNCYNLQLFVTLAEVNNLIPNEIIEEIKGVLDRAYKVLKEKYEKDSKWDTL